jgi:hypothetical protein
MLLAGNDPSRIARASLRPGGLMIRLRLAVVVVTLLLPPVSASAAVIGLSGGDSDPLLLTDPTPHILDEATCARSTVPLPAGYRCTLYDAAAFVDGIFALDVRLFDGAGHLIPVTASIVGTPLSDLPNVIPSPLFPDGFTFELIGDPAHRLFCSTCVFFASHDDGLADPAAVSSVAVNLIANPGVPAVPEPAMLLLMGMAAAATRVTARRGRTRGARTADR